MNIQKTMPGFFGLALTLSSLLCCGIFGMDQTENDEIIQAIQKGDLQYIEQYIAANLNNARTLPINKCPLHYAVKNNQLYIGNALLAAGAEVNRQSRKGAPLHYAAYFERPEFACALLKSGANVNLKAPLSNKKRTPLHLAALQGCTDTAEILVKAGADIDALDSDGKTPLQLAREQVAVGPSHSAIVNIALALCLLPIIIPTLIWGETVNLDGYDAIIKLLEQQNQRKNNLLGMSCTLTSK